jgi:hypothetical protein
MRPSEIYRAFLQEPNNSLSILWTSNFDRLCDKMFWTKGRYPYGLGATLRVNFYCDGLI